MQTALGLNKMKNLINYFDKNYPLISFDQLQNLNKKQYESYKTYLVINS